jgi:hypothetical protein
LHARLQLREILAVPAHNFSDRAQNERRRHRQLYRQRARPEKPADRAARACERERGAVAAGPVRERANRQFDGSAQRRLDRAHEAGLDNSRRHLRA